MAFTYPTLPAGDALRLLTLKAGGFFDLLEGDLIPMAFSAKPKYLALSYTWGDPTPEHSNLPATLRREATVSGGDPRGEGPITCQKEGVLTLNGHDVPITHNLALALRFLRSADHPLTLWVDAVCINQADIDERNSQVALMALIYSRATVVVTWLGLNAPEIVGNLKTFDEDGGSEAAHAMRDVYRLGNSKELASWFFGHTASSASSGVVARNLPDAQAAAEESLERMAAVNQLGDTMVMPTNYWHRVWVVQEVCLAQKVFFVYGPTLFVDEEAVRNAHQLNSIKIRGGMSSMLEARRVRFGEAMRFETLIEDFAGQLCSEPRDKIYGLIGLANDVRAVEGVAEDVDGRGSGGSGDEVSIPADGSEDVAFIIDYRRRFYDIWCDAVQYLFRCPYYFVPPYQDMDPGELARLRHERLIHVVRFAGLLQNTLQDEVERELAQLAASSPSASDIKTRLRGPKLLGRHLVPARGYLAGKILDLGPSYADFVSSFRHRTGWRTTWRKHYRKEFDLQKLREMEEQYEAKILEYGEADIARIAPICDGSFVAFSSPDDGPLDELTDPQSGADGVRVIDDILARLSVQGASKNAPGGKVNRLIGTDYCMGLAPPGAAVGDWVLRFWDCDAAVVVRPDNPSDPKTRCALVGRADVADVYNRKTSVGDVAANNALTRNAYDEGEDKRMDMLMQWRTLQLVTASIAT